MGFEGTWAKWYNETSYIFWMYNVPLAIWQFMLAMFNLIFLVAILGDFSRRSFVN
jgi:hypothetical protein